mmetsp:Transcript_5264/g.3986  ORF Transcript_5264/g.3986 Transcript_5264/m.3986 type:complete len:158 (+) Transcript_5264:436-909(+)|eukprot:CAMPEP_0202964204 /NCGR_PEP_ID=MMETSP1396-20130829/8281_1 /ASSEMBLY_ACC=CAM_ASM_000872 /TAXON_ID= /ORGANISM="Pseudokeronopsis sp., Strain Brazil" /LENGTH=157 /DNA_ID=CAMNT_0049686123 /DNA_START=436 /DNA_END=909 /DNA_ORIENTATION=-
MSPPIFVEMAKFDQDFLKQILDPLKDLPVKVFVNCMNSKRSKGQLKAGNGAGNEEGLMESQYVVEREEIYYLAKENIEGFVSLVNFFSNQMRQVENASLINVDNKIEPQFVPTLQDGHLVYKSSIMFQDTFTSLIPKYLDKVKSITVKVDIKNLPND